MGGLSPNRTLQITIIHLKGEKMKTAISEEELEFLDWKENVKADIRQDVKRALEQPLVP